MKSKEATKSWVPDMCTLFPVALSLALSLAVVGFGALFFAPRSLYDIPVFLILSLWQVLTSIAIICKTSSFWRGFHPISGRFLLSVCLFAVNWALGYMFLEVCKGFGLYDISNSFFLSLRETLLVIFTVISGMWIAHTHELLLEKTKQASQSQVEAIQARMNPHFLFNTINSIVAMIKKSPNEAEEAALCLSDLLRASLSDPQSSHSILSEMELIQGYLFIEKTRLGDRLKTSMGSPPASFQICKSQNSFSSQLSKTLLFTESLKKSPVVRFQ